MNRCSCESQKHDWKGALRPLAYGDVPLDLCFFAKDFYFEGVVYAMNSFFGVELYWLLRLNAKSPHVKCHLKPSDLLSVVKSYIMQVHNCWSGKMLFHYFTVTTDTCKGFSLVAENMCFISERLLVSMIFTTLPMSILDSRRFKAKHNNWRLRDCRSNVTTWESCWKTDTKPNRCGYWSGFEVW